MSLKMTTNEWQPIETAPQDGTAILAWDGTARLVVEYNTDSLPNGEGFWIVVVPQWWGWGEERNGDLTHWMPIPEPPEGAK